MRRSLSGAFFLLTVPIRWKLKSGGRSVRCYTGWSWSRVEHSAQPRVSSGKEIDRIRGKEHDGGHGDQRHQIEKNCQQNAADHDGQSDGSRVPGQPGRLAGEKCQDADSDAGNDEE